MAGAIDYGRVLRSVYESALNATEAELPLSTALNEIELADSELCGDLNLAAPLWRIARSTIEVDPSADEYKLGVPPEQFRRPCMAEITPREGGERTRRRIFIASPQDQDRYSPIRSDQFAGLYLGHGYGFEEIGFFRLGSPGDGAISVWSRVSPWPASPHSITIGYEQGPLVDAREQDTPGAVAAIADYGYPLLVAMAAAGCLAGMNHRPEPVITRKLSELNQRKGRLKASWDVAKMRDENADRSGITTGFSFGRRFGTPRY